MDMDLDKIRAYFSADRYAASAGIVIEAASEERVVCVMDITEAHLNASRLVQGGAIFTLADVAFGVHANLRRACGEKVGLTVGQSCAISYLRMPKGKRLLAASARLSGGRNISVYRVSVTDDLGVLVAEMHGNGFTLA
ncbi:MAG: PaaI family thioesterase [Deltaproteobacteria bacterium]|jgi:acyl-CoA thioesterase|nr:PaaI family thioesterase [Deltaproteobacteria bacterium]